MILTDTHIHLYAEEFEPDREQLISAAIGKGVSRFFIPNIDSSTINKMFDLRDRHPQHCFPMLGLHPCYIKENYREELSVVEQHLSAEKVFAIGEIGMDFFWDLSFTKEQEEVFITQINWADSMKLPVVIHSRNSLDEIISIIKKQKLKNLSGIFHCFTGTIEQAREVIELGFYLGVGGVVTFKNGGVDKLIEQIDLKNMLLETDAPYLAPVPYRGKRNEPAYIVTVAEKISAIKNIPVEEVARITTENSKMIFNI